MRLNGPQFEFRVCLPLRGKSSTPSHLSRYLRCLFSELIALCGSLRLNSSCVLILLRIKQPVFKEVFKLFSFAIKQKANPMSITPHNTTSATPVPNLTSGEPAVAMSQAGIGGEKSPVESPETRRQLPEGLPERPTGPQVHHGSGSFQTTVEAINEVTGQRLGADSPVKSTKLKHTFDVVTTINETSPKRLSKGSVNGSPSSSTRSQQGPSNVRENTGDSNIEYLASFGKPLPAGISTHDLELRLKIDNTRPIDAAVLARILNEVDGISPNAMKNNRQVTSFDELSKRLTDQHVKDWMGALGVTEAGYEDMKKNAFWSGLGNPSGSFLGSGVLTYMGAGAVGNGLGTWFGFGGSVLIGAANPAINALTQSAVVTTLEHSRGTRGLTMAQASNINDKHWLKTAAKDLETEAARFSDQSAAFRAVFDAAVRKTLSLT